MEQLRKLFNSLSVAQRVGIPVAALLVIAGLMSFVRWRHESDFRPLFSGMSAEDGAAIVQKLKESGVEHRLTDNGTSVLVPAAKVDELRLELAGAGLPRSGRIGFELFDKTNLGITDFTEHVNYRRALEGELERSIRSLSEVEQARIHISFPKESIYLDAREPAKASVLLTLRPGAHLSSSNVLAITNLVASAVEGLNPEFVSVVDMRGNLLSRPKKAISDPSDQSDAALEYKHQLEKDLFAKVESTLSPLLGEDHFRVGISADCDFSTSDETDETYDPTRSVMTNSQKSEDLSTRPDSAGVPGTPSNLPRPTSRPLTSGGSVSRRTENTAYETSRTVRQVKIPRGTIKRLSASILLDEEVRWQGTGSRAKRVARPPDPERIKAIHDIVAGVIGLSPARGDQLIVESLPFQQNWDNEPAPPELPAKQATPQDQLHKLLGYPKIVMGVGATILLLVGFGVFTLTRKKKKTVALVTTPASLAAPTTLDQAKTDKEIAAGQDGKVQVDGKSQKALETPDITAQVETLRQNVRETVNRDPALAAGVIRTWIAEAES
jgi:flagellar M-ring protein FliF